VTEQPLNLDVRPTSYWSSSDDPRARIHRVKGEDRRTSAEALLRDGEAQELASPEFDESLSEDAREFRGSIHPSLMSGEYLPDFEGDEVEIARVTLASVMGDVISIRARRLGALIHYRIVDEYEDEGSVYHCEPSDSEHPLTMRELIELMDNAHGEGMYPDYGIGLTTVWRNFHADNGSSPDEMVRFVRVSSEFYPDLDRYYEAEAAAWLQNRLAKYPMEDGDDERDDNDSDV
jgi:hypothetical protein